MPPWGGLLAALIVLAADAWLLSGDSLLWDRMAALTASDAHHMERGVISDRLQLQGLARKRERATICVIGSSRAQRALDYHRLEEEFGERAELFRFTHPGMRNFEVRSLVDEIRSLRPTLAVLILSEFDTHIPLPLRASTAAGSISATVDVVRLLGPGAAFRQRTEILRLGLAGALRSYRFRQILGATVVDPLLRLPRLRRPIKPSGFSVEPALLQESAAILPDTPRRTLHREALQITSLSHGPHVAVQTGLLRRAVQRLRSAGIFVVVIEAPLHPFAQRLYDQDLRAEFLAFMDEFSDDTGFRFAALEDSGTFTGAEFSDLSHVDEMGQRLLTDALIPILDEGLVLRE